MTFNIGDSVRDEFGNRGVIVAARGDTYVMDDGESLYVFDHHEISLDNEVRYEVRKFPHQHEHAWVLTRTVGWEAEAVAYFCTEADLDRFAQEMLGKDAT